MAQGLLLRVGPTPQLLLKSTLYKPLLVPDPNLQFKSSSTLPTPLNNKRLTFLALLMFVVELMLLPKQHQMTLKVF